MQHRQRYHEWIWWTSKWGAKLDKTYSRQSALISQSPLWYPALQKAASTPCSPKAEEAGGLHYPPTPTPPPPLPLPIFLSFFTHTFTIHTHTGPSFESLGLDLKFLLRACHAFYMHGEWERRGGIAWGYSPNELPSAVGLLRDTHAHTHFQSPHFLAPTQLFQH